MKLRRKANRERSSSPEHGRFGRRRKRAKKTEDNVWYHQVPPIFEEPISDDFLGLVASPEGEDRPYEEASVQVTVERSEPAVEVPYEPATEAYPGFAPHLERPPFAGVPEPEPHVWGDVAGDVEEAEEAVPVDLAGEAEAAAAADDPGAAPEPAPAPEEPADAETLTPEEVAEGWVPPEPDPEEPAAPEAETPEEVAEGWIPPEPEPEAEEPAAESLGEAEPSPAPPVAQRPFVHESAAPPAVDPPMITPIRAYYTTRADDTLRSVAAQFLNTASRWQELRSLNAAYPGIANAGPDTLLPVGSALALPGDPMPWGKPDPVYLWTLAETFLYTAWGREPSPEEVVPFWRGLTSGAKHLDMGPSAPPAIDTPEQAPMEPPIPPAMQPPTAPPPAEAASPAEPPEEPAAPAEPPEEPAAPPEPEAAVTPPEPEASPPEAAEPPEPEDAEPPLDESEDAELLLDELEAAEPDVAVPEDAELPPDEPDAAVAEADEPPEPEAVEAPEPEVVEPLLDQPEVAAAEAAEPPEPLLEEPPPAAPETVDPYAYEYEPPAPEPQAPAVHHLPPPAPPPIETPPAPPPAPPPFEPPAAPEAPLPTFEAPAPPDPPRYEPPTTPAPGFEPMPGMPDLGPIEPAGPAGPEQEAPPLPAFMPSLTGASPSAELPVEQIVGSSQRVLAGTAIGDAMMLWQLGRLRRRQGVTEGETVRDPLELSLEQTARMDSLRLIEAAMRQLRAVTVAQLKPKPRVVCVRTGTYGFEVLLDQAVEAPEGWRAASGGYVLELPRAVTLEQLDAVGQGPSLCPALVPVGDTAEGPLLLNIEEIGCLAVFGPNNPTSSLLTSIVETLGSSPLAGDIRIVTVGVSSPVGPGWERIHTTSYDSPQLEHLLSTAHSPAHSGAGSIDVLVVGPGHDLLFQRAGQIATTPGSRLMLVGATSSAAARWPWRIQVDEHSHAVVHPIAVNMMATQAMRPELAYLLSDAAEGSQSTSRLS